MKHYQRYFSSLWVLLCVQGSSEIGYLSYVSRIGSDRDRENEELKIFFCLIVCMFMWVLVVLLGCDTTLVEFCSPISLCDLFILLTDSN